MDFAFRMAEERIKEAEKNGAFQDLPGKGKPLDLTEINAVPEDLRMSYTILKNANMIPEEMQLKKDMLQIEELMALCEDEAQIDTYRRQLNEKYIRFQTLMEKRKVKSSAAYPQYRNKIDRKMGL
ncbi:DUF1992 domain-containing protein [Pontibacillus salicampi]|uniref:DUF1992 domain-containing protein n=1 Tax=Pontibacillus salicampi TaxID=1449801 RepID=A0ABV6LMP1_9BACI